MLISLLMLAAAPEWKDADGAVWTVKHGPKETLGGGAAFRQKHAVLRNGKKVGEVESDGFIQTNPDMAGSTEWQFEISDGVFQAVAISARHDAKKSIETKQVLRWNGKTLAAPEVQHSEDSGVRAPAPSKPRGQ